MRFTLISDRRVASNVDRVDISDGTCGTGLSRKTLNGGV